MTLHESYELTIPAFGAIVAVLLHAFVLKHFEVDHLTLTLCATSITTYTALSFIFGLRFATTTAASFYGTLTTTILLYRAFFHPLQGFRGPFAARLSKWWTLKQIFASNYRFSKTVMPQLKRTYGDYVRTGPRELLIFDPAAIQPILGFGSRAEKGPFYNNFEGSLHMSRDKRWHRQRRKVWDNGMKNLLTDFEPRIEEATTQLLEQIRRVGDAPLPLNEYCIFYSYDITSTLAFGQAMGFNTGQATEDGMRVLKVMESSMKIMTALAPVPWFLKAVGVLTQNVGPLKHWSDWNKARLTERRAMKDPKPDLVQYLLDVTPRTPAGDLDLLGECRLIIGAGAETTATALVFNLVMLGLHPEYQHALREEITKTEFSCRNPLPLLDSIINETLRLWPAILWATQRVTPPEGLAINGRFIPGDMVVAIAGFTIARDERNFVRPEEWIPERWTTKPELCINKAASIPFSTGAYSCAGKNLAMQQVRSVIARVVQRFDVVLPEEFNEKEFFDGVEDHFSAGVPKLKVRFVPVAV